MEAGWSKVDTQWVFGIGIAIFAVVMVFAGKKLATWGPQKLSIISGIVLGAGYILAGIFGGTDFWSILILIGIVGGAGIGFGYVVPIAVGMRWFPDKKGMITGLAVAGFGFGAMGWVKLAGTWGHLIANIGLSGTFIAYGIAFAAMVCIGGLFMKMPPEGWTPEGYTDEAAAAAGDDADTFESGEMLKTPQFYLIWITFLFTASAGLMSVGLMKLYPMEALMANGLSEAAAKGISGTALAVFFSLANGIGRIGWGTISDKIGRKASVTIMAATQGIFVLAFTLMAGTPALLYLALPLSASTLVETSHSSPL